MVHYTEREIDGVKYVISHFRATTAVKTFARLARMLGVPFAMMFTGKDVEVKEVLPRAMAELLEKAEPDALDDLLKTLISCVSVQNQPLYTDGNSSQYDTHFQGRTHVIFKLAVEVVKYQYNDFLAELVKYGGIQLAAVAPK